MFKKAGITTKLIVSSLTIALFVGIVGGLGLYGSGEIRRAMEELEEKDEFYSNLLYREVEHLMWAQAVMGAISARQNRVEAELDYRRCNFGLWYYSEARSAIVEDFPRLREPFDAIRKTSRRPSPKRRTD
jgi:methyl-accepting chemotaxis protein